MPVDSEEEVCKERERDDVENAQLSKKSEEKTKAKKRMNRAFAIGPICPAVCV